MEIEQEFAVNLMDDGGDNIETLGELVAYFEKHTAKMTYSPEEADQVFRDAWE